LPSPTITLDRLNRRIVACARCPRLVAHREATAASPPRRYRGQTYWARPLPGFGDPRAELLLVGLAPAANGGNRTGRMFTGDESGNWLYRALWEAGFANQPTSTHRKDGLRLTDCYITACVRCAPPGNHPTPQERDNCLPYLVKELEMLRQVRVIVCLGSFAWNGALRALAACGLAVKRKPRFSHGAEAVVGPYTLMGCFHPSQQNTFTGRLTRSMLDGVFRRAKRIAQAAESVSPEL